MPENLGTVAGGAPAIIGTGAGGTGGAGTGGGGSEGTGEGGGVVTEIEPTGEESVEGGGSEATGGEGEGAEGEPAAGEGEGEGEGSKAPEQTDGSEFETDGRKIDDATKKALAALKQVNPEAAKRTAEAYFKQQAYQKVFPTIHEARGAKATIEALGGQEGIQNLQTEVGDYRNEITQFAKGDPALIKNLWEANPEGVELSTVASIQHIAANDAEMFDRVLAAPMVTRLEKAGFYNALKNMGEHIKAGDGQKAYDLLQSMSKFFDNAKALSAKQLELKSKVDPERQKFEQERQDFEKQKTQEYENRIGTNANTLQNKAMAKVVEPFFKEIKLQNEGRREFVQNLQRKVWAAMKADGPFQMQARTIQKKGDAAETAEFIAEKFEELLPGIFRTYRNSLYPNYARLRVAAPAPAAGTNGSAPPLTPAKQVLLAKGARPKHNDVDWGKTSDIDWINGRATLVNGKRINFDKNSPPNRI